MRVVADSHAIVWYIAGSRRLSDTAASVLREAEATDGIVVSVASLIDLWYVTQTTEAVTAADLGALRTTLDGSAHVTLQEIGLAVVDSAATIPRDSLADPWDRLIVATANAHGIPLVTADRAIRASGLVQCFW